MIPRLITPPQDYSFFLLGPRGSGKSTLLKEMFRHRKDIIWIDLLNPQEEAIFQMDPSELERRISHLAKGSWIIVDEVQKVPKLLDLAHKFIEEKKLLFALSGSSARKLKRQSANLLAGRAFVFHLYPFTSLELKENFNLSRILQWGSLPKIFEFKKDEQRKMFLQAYADTYLREEIQIEQIVRALPSFRRFLEVAAQMNGQPLNYSRIGHDIHADHSVVRNYYEILEDTLVGFHLSSYAASIRKQQRKAPKFFFADCGLKRALDRTLSIPLLPRTYEFGRAFEHFIILEFFKLCHYRAKDELLFYLRTKDGVEVDLIIKRPGRSTLFIEIKSTAHLSDIDFSTLHRITHGLKDVEPYVVSLDPHRKVVGRVNAYYWQEFIELFMRDKI